MGVPTGDPFNLGTAPTIALEGDLVRVVSFAALVGRTPHDFLYASGKPNRFNPAGVGCVYFAEDERTAREEYLRGFSSLSSARQPRTTYFARVRLRRVLDLTDTATMEHVRLDPADLTAVWRATRSLVKTQRLGAAVAGQSRLAGIRYPSVAAQDAGFAGGNVVVFRRSLARGDRFEILGPDGLPLAAWP